MNYNYLLRILRLKIILALFSFACTPATAQWRYKNYEDKMRRSITQIAEIKSINKASLDFPYKGGSTLELNLRKMDLKEEDDVFFSIDRGQIPCFNICRIFSKFDNDEVIEWGGIGAESGRSDLIFIGNSREFIERLKSAKKLIIEIQIYNHGRFQFNFNVSGLKWKSQEKQIDKHDAKSYAELIVKAVKPNIVFTEVVSGDPEAVIEVRAAPTGTIIGRRLVKSSGSNEWDEAVLRAIDRTGSLPKGTDGRVPATVEIVFRPKD
jgi:TonB family protein